MLEDLNTIPKQTIIQQIGVGGAPPPPPPMGTISVPKKAVTRAFNQAITQLELLLEVKEAMLKIGNVEPDIAKQFKEDIIELKQKIKKHKGK